MVVTNMKCEYTHLFQTFSIINTLFAVCVPKLALSQIACFVSKILSSKLSTWKIPGARSPYTIYIVGGPSDPLTSSFVPFFGTQAM